MLFSNDNLNILKERLIFVVLIVLVFFLIIVARLFYLQIYQGSQYSKMATEVVVREEEIVARRGQILDRRGRVLAETRVYYEVTITPQYVSDLQKVVLQLSKLLSVDPAVIHQKIAQNKDRRKYHPIPILEDVNYDVVAQLSEYLNETYDENSAYDLSGVSVRAYPVREYVYPELFSHVLGYMREISQEQLDRKDKYPEDVYSLGDLIGVSGLEEQYDQYLKGRDGVMALVVDARGREIPGSDDVQVLKEKLSIQPQSGFHLRTSLDYEAQKAAQEAFPKGKKGAVVAMDPQTGEVLVLYSNPGYDTNKLIKNIDQAYWKELSKSKLQYNLATQGQYPPASTYKPIGVVAGIHDKKIDPEHTVIDCHGGTQFGNRYFKCWNKGGHGGMNVVTAMAQSCDVFFYKVGIAVGIDELSRVANLLGYGHPTGVDLPSEKSGHIPNSLNRKNLQPSDVLSLSIGQSYNLVTPLQMAKMVSMLANGGYEFHPQLALEVLNRENQVQKKFEHTLQTTELVGDPAMEWVRKGLYEVVNGRGTARRLQSSQYSIAGKTGTAQVMRFDPETRKMIELPNHALFLGFAPVEDPRIGVAVVVEHGGHGGSDAAPVAQAVIDAYLKQETDVQLKTVQKKQ